MVTPLQKAFSESKILQRAMTEYLEEEGAPISRGIYKDIFLYMSEAQIKDMLHWFLQCDDITDADRSEIIELLQL